ncbi:MAG TPA: class I SAM-dependent methyltransferase [Candidatus Thermoplasmatota archaeon]|nr:class I SAM-dependent methyltransferase [Candidatus Thermoplasmatota archaeon]
MDVRAHNRAAWDLLAASRDRWTVPVSPAQVAAARRGEWSVVLTNTRPVPRDWFPPSLRGLDVLALASAGGQQGPILAAAGANVTVLDNSPAQLAQDRLVAQREGLPLRTVEGTMEDLSAFPDASFDLVFNATSVLFTPDVRRVWREAARVLRPGGALLSGFLNPAVYLFGRDALDGLAPLVVKYRLPHADARDLPPEELAARVGRREPLEHSHTLEALIGGQLEAGLHLVAMYEDVFGDAALDAHMPGLLATRAVKR